MAAIDEMILGIELETTITLFGYILPSRIAHPTADKLAIVAAYLLAPCANGRESGLPRLLV
jgi:hypothetical protein